MQTYIVKVSGRILNISTIHFNGITSQMMLSIETCIRQTPCIERTLQHSPLNTGFTVPADNVLTVCSGWRYPPSPSQKKHTSRLYGDVFERVSGCLASSDKSHDFHLASFGPHSSVSYLSLALFIMPECVVS